VVDLESEHDDMVLRDHIAREDLAMLERIDVEEEAGPERNAVTSGTSTWRCGQSGPCLLLTDHPADDELAMVTVLPHTNCGQRQPLGVEYPKNVPQTGNIPPPANTADREPEALFAGFAMRDVATNATPFSSG
jgi:hypothetical protein